MSEGLSLRAVGDMSPGRSKGWLGAQAVFMQVPAWFDVRVFYVGVASCSFEDAPSTLTMRYPPRDISTALEVNGGRISPSEELNLTLRRDRLDKESLEATFVSTDNFRTNGSVSFEVSDGDQVLLFGNLERTDQCSEGIDDETSVSALSKPVKVSWKMELTYAVTSPNCSFLQGTRELSGVGLSIPTMEVCVVGRYSGSPVVLTETVQMTSRRKTIRRSLLDCIVEANEIERTPSDLSVAEPLEQVPAENQSYPDVTDKALARFGNFYGSDGNLNTYAECDDGEMSWFNASVRVGVGIGLGMCLGVGIGVGLMVRTYQVTTGTFRKKLF